MDNLTDVKTLWDDAFLAVSKKGVDVSGKPRNATHCPIGAYEQNWA